MNTSYLFLANGFEEIEAIAVIDLLRRADIPVTTVSIHPTTEVTGAHNVTIKADIALDSEPIAEAEYLILPGGMPGTTHLDQCTALKQLMANHALNGGKFAAICAAPLVLGGMGLLANKKATCYPGFESYLDGATATQASVEVDGTTITANGPGTAIPFALAIITQLKGEDTAQEIANGLQYKRV